MTRIDLTPLAPISKGHAPTPEELIDEFDAWCQRHGFERIPDDGVLRKLMDRRQRWWLTNLIMRWDWATEDAAGRPEALCTPLELAGAFMTVVREHSSQGELERVLARHADIGDYLNVHSVMATAFARVHRVPVDCDSTLAQLEPENALKRAALAVVHRFMHEDA